MDVQGPFVDAAQRCIFGIRLNAHPRLRGVHETAPMSKLSTPLKNLRQSSTSSRQITGTLTLIDQPRSIARFSSSSPRVADLFKLEVDLMIVRVILRASRGLRLLSADWALLIFTASYCSAEKPKRQYTVSGCLFQCRNRMCWSSIFND